MEKIYESACKKSWCHIIAASESQIEEGILQYLSYYRNATVIKIAPSGFFNSRAKKMVKHKSKFVRKGVSDILFWYNSKSYVFEVKTVAEYKYLMKRYIALQKAIPTSLNKKQLHLREQIDFIEDIKRSGNRGHFVCSVDQVKKILEN